MKTDPPDCESAPTAHGSARRACLCPGCDASIPACWASHTCLSCCAEDCEHEEPAPLQAPPKDHARQLADASSAVLRWLKTPGPEKEFHFDMGVLGMLNRRLADYEREASQPVVPHAVKGSTEQA